MPHPQYQGQNLPVYSICPNWKTPVTLRTIYSTIVRESLDLSETRRARLPRSLFALRYQTLPLDGQETGYIRRVIELAQALPVIIPVWTDACKLTVASGIGDNILQCDETFPTLFSVLYDYVLVWKDYKTWEVLATDVINPTSISLADEIQAVYPVGALCLPILIGKLPRMEARALTDEHGRHQVEFEERFHGLTDQSVVETILPAFESFLSYTDACRAEFVLTIPELEPETVYALEITDDPTGDWAPHIYFALASVDELATKTKELIVNNDYNGVPFFRIVRAFDGLGDPDFEVMSRHGSVAASVLAPPVISMANLSEITTDAMLATIQGIGGGDTTNGVRSLEYYSDGGYVIPYSAIEDPVAFSSLQYRRFQKQYAGRQYQAGGAGTLLADTGTSNTVVSVTGPVGATIKWTRDLTDPTLATPAPLSYNGVANNGYAWENKFSGIIKARCFKDGCRSPLAMVAVTKLMYEKPVFKTTGMSNDAGSYCDLPDPVDGSESGQSCNLLFGGTCGFEAVNYAGGTSGGMMANGGILLYSRGKNVYNSTYLGWPIHGSHSSYYQFAASTWGHFFNGWFDTPTTVHSWAITNMTPSVIESDVLMNFGGPDVNGDRSAWNGIRDTEIQARLPVPASPGCGSNFLDQFSMTRFDVTRSPLYWQEMRDLFWLVPTFVPPPVIDDPVPPPPNPVPFEGFETYTDGNKVGDVTLNFREGVDWDGSWDVRDGPAPQKGVDYFDYADGIVPDHNPTPDLEYVPYDDGEGWLIPAEEWYFNTPENSTVYRESWDAFSNGALPFDVATTGTGFTLGTGEGWVTGAAPNGVETWDGYADGAFVPDDTGSAFVLGENWVARDATAKYWRVIITVAANPVGNAMGMTEFELRETTGGTNWALASNGGVALASSEFSGTFAASKAIDGDSAGSSGWANNNTSTSGGIASLRITLATPRWIKEYKVGHYPTGSQYPAPAAWNFEYSYDGTIWMGQLSMITGQTVWSIGELKTFTIN